MSRAAEEEGVVEGAVLSECVGRPGLKVGAELARVAFGVGVLLEVLDGDGRSEKEEGLGGCEVASIAKVAAQLADIERKKALAEAAKLAKIEPNRFET